jgi:bifunctional lysine-specific demethylase and histidyl-hydroxylase NO66
MDGRKIRPGPRLRPEPVAPLAQATAAAALTADTVLRVRPRLRCQLREPAGDRVTLVAGRRSLELPASTRPALAALLAAGELKAADLPGLDDADQLTLARRLVTESIAVVPDAVVPTPVPGHDGTRDGAPGAGS